MAEEEAPPPTTGCLCSWIDECSEFLQTWERFHAVHTVSFFVNDAFARDVPEDWKEALAKMSVADIVHLPTLYSRAVPEGGSPSLRGYLQLAESLTLKKRLASCGTCTKCDKTWWANGSSVSSHSAASLPDELVSNLRGVRNMGLKKKHEVEIMAPMVHTVGNKCNCDTVVDVGGGQGYLSHVVAHFYGMRVIGVDSSPHNSEKAQQRSELIAALMSKKRKLDAADGNGGSAQAPTGPVEAGGGSYRPLTSFIDPSTDAVSFDDYLKAECGGGALPPPDRVLMTGLHTCGDLGPTMLRVFVRSPMIRTLVNVGCCYNLLSTAVDAKINTAAAGPDAASAPVMAGTTAAADMWGFPLSGHMKERGLVLNHGARTLACQAVERWNVADAEESFVSHYHRCLLEVAFHRFNGGPPARHCGHISKAKSPTFAKYARAAIVKVGLGDDFVTDAQLEALDVEFRPQFHDLKAYWCLRAVSASVIEATILLDRLMYIREHGIKADLTQIFNAEISPRCHAIVAYKE